MNWVRHRDPPCRIATSASSLSTTYINWWRICSITHEDYLHCYCKQQTFKSCASCDSQKWHFIAELREESRRWRSNFVLRQDNELASVIPSPRIFRSLTTPLQTEYLATSNGTLLLRYSSNSYAICPRTRFVLTRWLFAMWRPASCCVILRRKRRNNGNIHRAAPHPV